MIANARSGGRGLGSRWRIAAWGAAAALLLVPLVAMQVTDEVAWTASDFAFAGGLLAGVGVAYELAVRMTRNRAYWAATGVALAGVFLLVWMNAAVGIIGTENNPANLMFGGVLVTGLVVAVFARFQANGMAAALVAMAVAQALVAVIALVAGLGFVGPLTGVFFCAMWLLSAWLFRRAAAGSR